MFLTVASETTLKAVTTDGTKFEVTDQISALRACRHEAKVTDQPITHAMCSSSLDFPEEEGMSRETCDRLTEDFCSAMAYANEMRKEAL